MNHNSLSDIVPRHSLVGPWENASGVSEDCKLTIDSFFAMEPNQMYGVAIIFAAS